MGDRVGPGVVSSEVHVGVASEIGQEVAANEGDKDGSDDNVAGVHMNDSEWEMIVGLDDGFGGRGTSGVGQRMRKKTVAPHRPFGSPIKRGSRLG
ncbi:type II secretion system protein GspD [Sesbania bispinosa]|nr:type II secretion system protein GspD [Sesbania bispinosa]